MRRAAIALALLLGACASHRMPPPEPAVVLESRARPAVTEALGVAPEIRTVTVEKPVAAPCRASVKEPAHPDTAAALRAAPSVEDRYQLMAAGRQVWIAWAKELETALRKCGAQVGGQAAGR